jgi:hypothetical protein
LTKTALLAKRALQDFAKLIPIQIPSSHDERIRQESASDQTADPIFSVREIIENAAYGDWPRPLSWKKRLNTSRWLENGPGFQEWSNCEKEVSESESESESGKMATNTTATCIYACVSLNITKAFLPQVFFIP